MKKSELEKYLNKKVKIELFCGTIIEGELHKTGEEQFRNNIDLYYRPNYYFCIDPQSYLFRSSHVKKLIKGGRINENNRAICDIRR